MLRLATLIWVILGTALAGSLVIVVLTVPALSAKGMAFIPAAARSGFLAAIPLAALIARKIMSATMARS
jgi:hypothetical protein